MTGREYIEMEDAVTNKNLVWMTTESHWGKICALAKSIMSKKEKDKRTERDVHCNFGVDMGTDEGVFSP